MSTSAIIGLCIVCLIVGGAAMLAFISWLERHAGPKF